MRRPQNGGWRSARWRLAGQAALPLPTGGGDIAPAIAAPQQRRRGQAQPAAQMPQTDFAQTRWPWQGVRWSLGLVAFLAYYVSVISYRVPIAKEAMAVASAAVLFGLGDRIRLTATWGWLASYLAFGVLTAPMSPYQITDATPILDFTKVVMITLVAVSVLRDRARIRLFVFAYLALFALFPVRGALLNFFLYGATEFGRVSWSFVFNNPNDLATLLILPLGLAAGILYVEREKWLRIAALAGCFLIPLVIFLTQSRGAIIGLAGGATIVFFFKSRKRGRTLLSLAAISVVLFLFAPKDVWNRLGNLSSAAQSGNLWMADDGGSAQQRYEIWRVARAIARDHLATGVGLGAYRIANMDYTKRPGNTFSPISRGYRDAHSTYLTVVAETGIPGMILWVTLVLTATWKGISTVLRVRRLFPARAMQLQVLLASLFAFGIASIFSTMNAQPFTYIHLALIIVMSEQLLEDEALVQGRRLRTG